MSKAAYPDIHYFDTREKSELIKNFPLIKNEGLVQVGDKKYSFPSQYVKDIGIYYNIKVEPNDTWIISYPRSGSTWAQELIWLIKNDLDFKTANKVLLEERIVFFELSLITENNSSVDRKSYEQVQHMKRPRFIKTHFPLELIPNVLKSNAKVVYVARNPKDTAVSLYHFLKERHGSYTGDFEQFWDYFERDYLTWSPYWAHLKEAWTLQDRPNFLLIFYEDMQHDLIRQAKRVANFFNKSYSQDQYDKLAQHLRFDTFKNNRMVNYYHCKNSQVGNQCFIRKGQSQNWQEVFTPDLNIRANKWIEEKLKSTGIIFPHIDIYA